MCANQLHYENNWYFFFIIKIKIKYNFLFYMELILNNANKIYKRIKKLFKKIMELRNIILEKRFNFLNINILLLLYMKISMN